MSWEEFILRCLVQAARDAAEKLTAFVHDDWCVKCQLIDGATAIETTLDVWRAMERLKFRDLLKPPIDFEPKSWSKAR